VGLGEPLQVQERSWFDPGWGETGRQKRVAQIFFATNERQLDRMDWSELTRLADHYAIRLEHGITVRLTFIGHTDASGSESYNRQLSEDRAGVVAEEVLDQLRTRLKAGGMEDRLAKYTPSLHGMSEWLSSDTDHTKWARDRRVDVYEDRPQEIAALMEQLRTVAERGIRRYAEGIRKYQAIVQDHRKRVAQGPRQGYWINLLDLSDSEARLRQLEADYRSYNDAIAKGDEAFLDWLNRERPSALHRARERLRQSEALEQQVTADLRAAPPQDRPFYAETLEFIRSDIESAKDDIRFLERDATWEREAEERRQPP
jgi:outer membrane protein OmpA-like peptidoglycan-associated protein